MIVQSILAKGKVPGKPDDFEAWLGDRHKWLQQPLISLLSAKHLLRKQSLPN